MITIRLMQKSGLDALSKIYAEVYRVFDVGEKWTEESAYNLLSFCFDRQSDLCFTAEYDNKIVGAFVAGVKPWWNGNHLVDGEIFIDPQYQKKGIGKELMKTMFKNAIEKYNVKILDGITFKKFDFPLSWYKSLGFQEVEDWVVISGDITKALEKLERKNK